MWASATVALVVSVGWLLLAVSHPTTTYHFAPLIIVIAPVMFMRISVEYRLRWRYVLASTGTGAAIALATTTVLVAWGALRGPSIADHLGGDSGAIGEAFITIGLGVAIVIAIAIAGTVVGYAHARK